MMYSTCIDNHVFPSELRRACTSCAKTATYSFLFPLVISLFLFRTAWILE